MVRCEVMPLHPTVPDAGLKKDEAILQELQKLIKESKDIRFEGNGYGEEWVKEAKKRGLSNFLFSFHRF